MTSRDAELDQNDRQTRQETAPCPPAPLPPAKEATLQAPSKPGGGPIADDLAAAVAAQRGVIAPLADAPIGEPPQAVQRCFDEAAAAVRVETTAVWQPPTIPPASQPRQSL